MEKLEYWWIEDLLDTDHKALGTYLALLYLRIFHKYKTYTSKPDLKDIEPIFQEFWLRDLYAHYFAGKGPEAFEALEAGRLFILRLFEHEDVLVDSKRNSILDRIESKFLDRFAKSFENYLKLNSIPEQLRDLVGRLLLSARNRLFGERLTLSGTNEVDERSLMEFLSKFGIEAKPVINAIWESKLTWRYSRYVVYYVFPAPCLTDRILRLITERVSPLRPSRLERRSQFERLKPGREVLERVVATVLEDLGFDVETNVKKLSKVGALIEVDVWAQRRIPGVRFSVYVSCKNWDQAVGRPVIDGEFGRIINLRETPQLTVIVAKELTQDARQAAEADGFVVIELGEKVNAENAAEIYDTVYKYFNQLFTAIAPPELRDLASRVSEIAKELNRIADELSRISTRTST